MKLARSMMALLFLIGGQVVAQSTDAVAMQPAAVAAEPDAAASANAAESSVHPTSVPAAPTVRAGVSLVPNGTVVEIELAEPISSQRSKRGDKFALRLATPLLVDGRIALPAGIVGAGEIVHAASSGGGGKPGELLLAARYLEFEGQRIPLRGFRLGANGKDQTRGALAASMAMGPFAQFIHGREIEIPSGARASAKFAADTVLASTNPSSTTQE